METIEIITFKASESGAAKLPLFTMSVSAGTPVPVENDIEKEVDLNEFLIEHPNSTFFARVRGASLYHVGVQDNDILVVDEAKTPKNGNIIVASINEEMTVKIFRIDDEGDIYLESQNGRYLPVKIDPFMEFKVLGTVTKIIRSL